MSDPQTGKRLPKSVTIEDFEVAIMNKFLQKSWLNNQQRTWFYNTKDHAFKTQNKILELKVQ